MIIMDVVYKLMYATYRGHTEVLMNDTWRKKELKWFYKNIYIIDL